MNIFNQAYGEDGSILQSQKKLNSWDISTQRCFFHFWPVSSSSQCCLPQLERFSYDLEMKTREQNRNKKRAEIERFDWFIERIQTRVAFGCLSERSAEKNFMLENFLEINRYLATRLAHRTMPSPY